MTPDEHYRRAEELAGQAAGTFQMIIETGAQRPIDADIRAAWFAEMGVLARLAQVHATLATRTTAPPPPEPPAASPYGPPNPYSGAPVNQHSGPYPPQPPVWTPPPGYPGQ